METSTLPPALRDSIQWAGNGVLTYYDPEFPYADLAPQQINNARVVYATEEDQYTLETNCECLDTPLPPSCRVQYPYEPREVLAVLEREVSSSSNSPSLPSSPGSPGSSQGENYEPGPDFETDEMPSPVSPPVHRQAAIGNHRAPEPERSQQRIADRERRHPRHQSPSPPSEPPRGRREPEQGSGYQGPSARRVQEQARRQQPQPHPSSRNEHGARGQRPPPVYVAPNHSSDSLRERFEDLNVRTEPPSPEVPAPTPPGVATSQSRSARPENPRRRATHTGSSSSSSGRGHRSHEGRSHGERRQVQEPRGAHLDTVQERRSQAPPQAEPPSSRDTRPANLSRSTTDTDPSPSSRQTRTSLAAQLSIIDANSNVTSRTRREDDAGSMVVQFHRDSASAIRRRRRRERRDSRPAPPARSKSSGLGFLRHFVGNA